MFCFSILPLKDEQSPQEDRQQGTRATRDLQMAAMFYVLLCTPRRSVGRTWPWEEGVQHNSTSKVSALPFFTQEPVWEQTAAQHRGNLWGICGGGICTALYVHAQNPKGKNESHIRQPTCFVYLEKWI